MLSTLQSEVCFTLKLLTYDLGLDGWGLGLGLGLEPVALLTSLQNVKVASAVIFLNQCCRTKSTTRKTASKLPRGKTLPRDLTSSLHAHRKNQR